jgi:hypothetical protein
LRRREHSFENQALSTDGSTVAIGSNRVFPLSRLERAVRRPCLLASLMAAWLACSHGGWRPNPEPSHQPRTVAPTPTPTPTPTPIPIPTPAPPHHPAPVSLAPLVPVRPGRRRPATLTCSPVAPVGSAIRTYRPQSHAHRLGPRASRLSRRCSSRRRVVSEAAWLSHIASHQVATLPRHCLLCARFLGLVVRAGFQNQAHRVPAVPSNACRVTPT